MNKYKMKMLIIGMCVTMCSIHAMKKGGADMRIPKKTGTAVPASIQSNLTVEKKSKKNGFSDQELLIMDLMADKGKVSHEVLNSRKTDAFIKSIDKLMGGLEYKSPLDMQDLAKKVSFLGDDLLGKNRDPLDFSKVSDVDLVKATFAYCASCALDSDSKTAGYQLRVVDIFVLCQKELKKRKKSLISLMLDMTIRVKDCSSNPLFITGAEELFEAFCR